jgi:hypothetical protein
MKTTYQAADKAIAAYDAFVFASVGKSFDNDRADLLAWDAMVECGKVGRDMSYNEVTRKYYRDHSAEFSRIIAA